MSFGKGQRRAALVVAGAMIFSFAAGLAAPSAQADDGASQQKCIATPEQVKKIVHDEVSHLEEIVTPGQDEVSHLEQRWSRTVPDVAEKSHLEYRFYRDVPAQEEEYYLQYKYWKTLPGQDEVSHLEYQFYREVPGQDEKSHKEYKYKKVVKNDHVEYKYRTRDVKHKWSVGKVYAQDVYDRVKDKGKWTYVKVASSGDHHPSLYGPYTVYNDPNTVRFNVGSGNRLVGEEFDYDERAYNASGDSITVKYKYVLVSGPTPNGYTDWSSWSSWSTTNPGPESDTKEVRTQTVDDPDTIVYYKDGAWTTETLGSPWVKIDERKVIDQVKTDPYTEYRKADGTGSTDVADAARFPESSFEGWNQFGDPKKVVDQEAIPPKTVYLKSDFTVTEVLEEAGWINSDAEVDEAWSRLLDADDRPLVNKVVTRAAIPGYTEYRKADGTASKDVADAAQFKESSFEGWNQFGNPEKVVDQAFVPGYTEYYVSGGTPTRELGESNWTTDTPEGWTFVDERKVVDQIAIPPVTEKVKVVDKAAWVETKTTPATYTECLALTGSDIPPWFYGLIVALLAGGTAIVVMARKRKTSDEWEEAVAVEGEVL